MSRKGNSLRTNSKPLKREFFFCHFIANWQFSEKKVFSKNRSFFFLKKKKIRESIAVGYLFALLTLALCLCFNTKTQLAFCWAEAACLLLPVERLPGVPSLLLPLFSRNLIARNFFQSSPTLLDANMRLRTATYVCYYVPQTFVIY